MKTKIVTVGKLKVGDLCRGTQKARVRVTDISRCGSGLFVCLDGKPDGIMDPSTEVERFGTDEQAA